MHELSIAQAIVDVAVRHARGRRVERVEVRIGHLRQVVPSALDFAFELCAHGTPVEAARLEIEHVPIVTSCRNCGVESEQDGFPLTCPSCEGLAMDVVRGEELQVESLELVGEELLSSGG
jgi:hydrogenase nickel incorporation protein HypA/HybF